MVTIEENWHWYTEHQVIYNIHTINSSYEIMSVLEYQVFSLWDNYDSNYITTIVQTDLSAAFDTVDAMTLIVK